MLKYYLPTKFNDLQHNIVKDWCDKNILNYYLMIDIQMILFIQHYN